MKNAHMKTARMFRLAAAAALATIALASSSRAQPCAAAWGNEFYRNGLDDASVAASAVFDPDGAGPLPACLFVGGKLRTAENHPANFVAKWDGHAWSSAGTGLRGAVTALAAYDDDGPGPHPPQLFATTNQAAYGDTPLHVLVGDAWQPAPGLVGGTGYAYSLLVFDDDGPGPHAPRLLVGGGRINIGASSTSALAAWDGATWTDIGAGIDGSVYTLSVLDVDGAGPTPPALYVGGSFAHAGSGFDAHGIARWDGATWSPLGDGFGSYPRVYAIAAYDDDGDGPHPTCIYAGGLLRRDEGSPAEALARWDGATWSAVGGDVGADLSPPTVNTLAVFDPDGAGPGSPLLFAGGYLASIGDVGLANIGAWDGKAWSPVAGGANHPVRTFAAFDDDGDGPHTPALIAGGEFALAGSVRANRIASLGDNGWRALGGGVGCGRAGDIDRVTPFEPAGFSMTTYDPDGPGPAPATLIVSGLFTTAGDVAATYIASWDGQQWAALGDGLVNSWADSLTTFDAEGAGSPQLFAGGYFFVPGPQGGHGLLRWNGAAWSPVPDWDGGAVDFVGGLDPDGDGPAPPALYVGGFDLRADGQDMHSVARWDGQSWSHLGDTLDGNYIHALAFYDEDGDGPAPPALFAACAQAVTGAADLRGLARFNGATWETVSGGLRASMYDNAPGRGYALAVWDDDGPGPRRPALYVGGDFDLAGGVPASGLARWDGVHWQGLTSPSLVDVVDALAVFDDDGPGPLRSALYAGGFLSVTGGPGAIPQRGIGRWSGTQWTNPGGGVSLGDFLEVHSMAVFDPDGSRSRLPRLYVAGAFTHAGAFDAVRIASFGSPCYDCPGDLNADGLVNPTDLGILLGSWGPSASSADLTGDGVVNSADLALLLGAFGACP